MNIEDQFLKACKRNHKQKFDKLLNEVPINYKDDNGNTALINAADFGNLYMVNKLIDKGADIDLITNKWVTALMLACLNNHIDVVEKLVNSGADVNLQDVDGWTALMYASYNGHSDIVRKLKDVTFNLTNNDDHTAYDLAVQENHIQAMYEYDNNIINHKDELGNTLLIQACKILNKDNILFLYNAGAYFYTENNTGNSAFDFLATKNDLPPEIQTLKEKLLLERSTNNIDDFDSLGL